MLTLTSLVRGGVRFTWGGNWFDTVGTFCWVSFAHEGGKRLHRTPRHTAHRVSASTRAVPGRGALQSPPENCAPNFRSSTLQSFSEVCKQVGVSEAPGGAVAGTHSPMGIGKAPQPSVMVTYGTVLVHISPLDSSTVSCPTCASGLALRPSLHVAAAKISSLLHLS